MPDPVLSTFDSRMRRSDPAIGSPAVARARRGRWLWAALPIIAAFGVFGVVVWLAYKDTSIGAPTGEPPLIRALADPIKLPPEQAEESTVAEGGAIGRLWSNDERVDQPERLLPPPEQPLSPPVIATPDAITESPAEPGSLPSSDGPGEVAATDRPSATESPQPEQNDAMAEAEAALDRLLAEVTALSEETPTAPGAVTGPAPGQVEASDESRPAAEAAAAPSAPTPERSAPAEPVNAPEAESAATATTAPSDASTTESSEIRQASALSEPPPAPAPAPRESAAPAPAATPARAPTVSPAPAPTETTRLAAIEDRFRVQLAAVREEAGARRAWDLFLADLGPVLSDVQPFFERAETANGTFYRVQIGPFATQQAAESRCEELKQRNASCFVIRR